MPFLRYLLVQAAAYVIDFGSFLTLLYIGILGPLVANIFAKIAAGLFAFLYHRHYTFQDGQSQDWRRQAILYALLLAINIPITTFLLAIALPIIPAPAAAKLISDVIAVALTYFLSKRFIFSKAFVDTIQEPE